MSSVNSNTGQWKPGEEPLAILPKCKTLGIGETRKSGNQEAYKEVIFDLGFKNEVRGFQLDKDGTRGNGDKKCK